jgi:hypothetical protein
MMSYFRCARGNFPQHTTPHHITTINKKKRKKKAASSGEEDANARVRHEKWRRGVSRGREGDIPQDYVKGSKLALNLHVVRGCVARKTNLGVRRRRK